MSLLEISGLSISFGGLNAVSNFSLTMEKGHLYGLIGPNGAGKTTIFNMLTGVYKPTGGKILLDGENITGKNPEFISKAGIARTFQNIRLFDALSVLDNVKAGLHNRISYGMMTGIFRTPVYARKENEMTEKAFEILKISNWMKKRT
jgi:branched-chain amino acid transport system ATP-binding protein